MGGDARFESGVGSPWELMAEVGKLLRSRVGLVIDLKQVFYRELSVTLRGRQSLVTKQFLNRAQVGAFFEHVGTESMAQGVGVDVGRESFGDGYFLDDPAHAAGGQASAAAIDHERCSGLPGF